MDLLTRLTEDMKSAMKARDSARLSVIRMLVSAVRYVGIDKGQMTDDEVIKVLVKEAKKRRESITSFRDGGREEQAKQEEYELTVIDEYLPKQMSEVEVETKVKELLQNKDVRSQNMGQVIGMVMKELGGQADGKLVAKIVNEIFATS